MVSALVGDVPSRRVGLVGARGSPWATECKKPPCGGSGSDRCWLCLSVIWQLSTLR